MKPAANGAGGKPLVVTVPPAPVPVQVVVEQGDVAGQPVVVVRCFTPTGQAVYFLPLDGARTVGQMILDHATPLTLP